MRLLVVEDEQSLREDITKKLQHSGYEVDACGDGETASEYLAVEYYDLVLLDLNLPKIDGMMLLRNFRKENQETPVLILSARSDFASLIISHGIAMPANIQHITVSHAGSARRSYRTMPRNAQQND